MADAILRSSCVVAVFLGTLPCFFYLAFLVLYEFVFGDDSVVFAVWFGLAVAILSSLATTFQFWRYIIKHNVGSRFLWVCLTVALLLAASFVYGILFA
jgi:hypothetical protein